MAQSTATASAPSFTFSIDDSLAEWTVPPRVWLSSHEELLNQRQIKLDRLATGNLVFNKDSKILLLQRAPHDSLPNRWEIPGGGADDSDSSILHSAARELWEETGLVATRFHHLVTEGTAGRDLQIFPNSTKTLWLCRFSFNVQVQNPAQVTLDPAEHQDFVWASEEEVRAGKAGHRDIIITNDAMRLVILEGFSLQNASS
ncbi:hypothetical protein NQ176_g3176 [Zarea fungicola]|uniref:Uncharacterized protein n=1 Tax=Zarea fungicola TaxID=93591 RepID=A0ACC1NJV2_9HYPO|nr:hypothetical protein NQ176_g3176 [Lecanicillium fungicola]